MARQTHFRWSKRICRIDASAFAAVLIALLWMFMPMVYEDLPTRPSVELPRASHSVPLDSAIREDALIVAVGRDGHVFFGSSRVNPADLSSKIREGLRNGAEPRVYLKIDSRAKYRPVELALDAARDAGVENVAVMTERRRP